MGHVHKEMLGARLLPFVHPIKGTDLASGHPDLGQSRQPPSKWLLPERSVEKADQLGTVPHPVRVRRVAWKACTPTIAASSEVRTIVPRPVRSRSRSAARTP